MFYLENTPGRTCIVDKKEFLLCRNDGKGSKVPLIIHHYPKQSASSACNFPN